MHFQPLIMLAMSTSTVLAQTNGSPDLVFDNLEILSIELVDSRYEIGIGYSILNIGTSLIDLAGPDTVNPFDNIAIQTYMTFDPSLTEPFYASAGSIIENPVVLDPGESFEGVFFANTMLIPDPTSIDPNMWIVLDILTGSVPSEMAKNNRGMIQVPAPAGAVLLASAGLFVSTRRRR